MCEANLDDRVDPEDRSWIIWVRGESDLPVCGDAEVLPGGHVSETNLLLPSDHITLDEKLLFN